MIVLLRALSWNALRRHRLQIALAVLGVASGVATFSSLRASQTALVSGMTATIGQLAGTADVQVSGVGGVPESLRDRLIELPGVRAVAPAVEEVVALEPPALGSVLVFGIDLVGDRGMRDYRFDAADADVDDPLEFLAQPDSVAVSKTLADRLHLEKGSAITVRVRSVVKRLVVRAVIGAGPLSRAFGGAIVVTDVYAAQDLLGRGRRFDRLDLDAEAGTSGDDLRRTVAAAIGGGYTVDTPKHRGESRRTLIRHFDASFRVSRILAVVIAAFLISNVFAVAVQGRRREIAILRTLGASSTQIQGWLLVEAAAVGCIGAVAGLVLGRVVAGGSLTLMREAVGRLYGLSSSATPEITARLAIESIGLGLAASIGGAWLPARAACRVPAVETLASGVFASRRPGLARWQASAVIAAIVTFAVAYARPAADETLFLFSTLIPVGVALSILARPVADLLLASAARLMRHAGPMSLQMAIDALRSQPRRTATAAAAMIMTLAFALGIASQMRALNETFSSWIDRTYDADLYVRGSSGFAPSAVRLPWSIASEFARVSGVRSVTGLRYDLVTHEGREMMLAAADVPLMREWLTRDLVQRAPEFSEPDLDRDDVCLISDNLARQRGLHAGDRVVLDTPAGTVTLRVGAVVNLLLSEYGVLVVNRASFERRWSDDRADLLRITYQPGEDGSAVQRAIAARMAGSQPALISTRAELVAEARQAIDSFVVFTRITAIMAAAVAFINVVTALVISVAERARELALLRVLGAVDAQINRLVIVEAVIVTMGGLALAVPVGAGLAWLFTRALMTAYFGFYMQPAYAYDLLLTLTVVLPLVAAFAAWLPARRAAAARPQFALGHE